VGCAYLKQEGYYYIEDSTKIVAGKSYVFKIIYVNGIESLKAEDSLELSIPLSWSIPSKDSNDAGYFEVSSNAKATLLTEIIRRRTIRINITGGMINPGEKITVYYGNSDSGARVQKVVCDGTAEFKLSVLRENQIKDIHSLSSITVIPSSPAHINLTVPSYAQPGTKIKVKAQIVDEYGNPIKDINDDILIFKNDCSSSIFTEKLEKGYGEFYITHETEGILRVKATLLNTLDIFSVSNPCIITKDEDYHIYWGDIHGHSNISDGIGSPDFFYNYARYVTHLDFAALTDHDYEVNHAWFNRKVQRLSDEQWAFLKHLADEYNDDGSFITFLGYEWTGRPYGDKCVIYRDKDMPIFRCDEHSHPLELWDKIKQHDGISICHTTSNAFMGSAWEYFDEKAQPLLEIYSCHGTSEFYGNPNPILNAVKGQFAVDALNMGQILGFTAGSDSHISMLGNKYSPPGPYRTLRFKPGLTAVLCNELNRSSIFEALRKRRCYATTGERIILDFSINGHLMGDIFIEKGKRSIYVKAIGTSKIERIELISEGKIIYSIEPNDYRTELRYIDESDFKDKKYYYVRVTQKDGNRAWSSPIWVSKDL